MHEHMCFDLIIYNYTIDFQQAVKINSMPQAGDDSNGKIVLNPFVACSLLGVIKYVFLPLTIDPNEGASSYIS